jgi:hypothetical protein
MVSRNLHRLLSRLDVGCGVSDTVARRIGHVGRFQTQLYPRGADSARGFAKGSPSTSEGAGNAGCALHPRSRVQNCTRKNAHEHTGSAETLRHSLRDGFTAYAVISPATNSSCHRRCRLEADRIRLDRISHRQLGTSNGCRDHTVLPYATATFVLRADPRSRETRPAIALRADAAASTTSHPAFVTTRDPPLLPGWDGAG